MELTQLLPVLDQVVVEGSPVRTVCSHGQLAHRGIEVVEGTAGAHGSTQLGVDAECTHQVHILSALQLGGGDRPLLDGLEEEGGQVVLDEGIRSGPFFSCSLAYLR